ncbi:hypothetical protein PL373_05930 [Tenacibaculum maritimum]|nr:hypothetical protein [Tenacibaculum maritimum]MDB0600689.1 hypothetical protein [Tenacibaculum maritimum]MDB0612672.1 hypothetical protein [Tenacibaculum maritimum]
MSSYIEIGKHIFKTGKVNSVRVKRSRKTIGNTAVIKLPNYRKQLDSEINVGDPVLIKLGYEEDLITEFTGYVSSVSPKSPLEIHCEDQIWKLKQEQVTKSWKSTSLHKVLKYLVPDIDIECQDIEMSPFRLNKVNKAEALAKIKSNFGLDAFFRNGKLYVGFAYNEKGTPLEKFHFQENARVHQLVYKRKESVKLKVKAISILPNNTRITVELGDKDGDQRTLHYYNKTAADLNIIAKEHIKQMKYDGYQGAFKSVGGVPFVDHSMIVKIQDNKYLNRAGSYFVDQVITTYDKNGYKRIITLGKKAA